MVNDFLRVSFVSIRLGHASFSVSQLHAPPSVDCIEHSTRRIYSRIFHVFLLVQGIGLFFVHTIDIILDCDCRHPFANARQSVSWLPH